MQKEQEEKETQLRNIRLQEEARKREEYLKEREKIRESEIKELRAIQENHMEELKRREKESSELQKEEEHLRHLSDIIENELIALSQRRANKTSNIPMSYNLNRIKMIIRKRSDNFRNELRKDIEALQRIGVYCSDENLKHLIEKFEMQYDVEIQKQPQIEFMYESETKHNLEKWEETWSQQDEVRQVQIKNLLEKQKKIVENKLSENIKQQKRLVEIQEAHLAAIENSNDKLKILIKKQEDCKQHIAIYASVDQKKRTVDATVRDLSHCEIRQDSLAPPKFGRKKTAWT